MTLQSVAINGKKHRLGKRVGRGGEGDVYLLEDDHSVAVKIYTLASLDDRAEKIKAFVQEELYKRASQVAFPIAEVHNTQTGVFIGFTMKMVANYKPLHELYAPGARRVHFPQADYRFLVRTASNIARAVASVHANNCVIGDINHSGILVSDRAMVSLIDADSFQIKTRNGQFLCKVGVPEYTPPELQGASLQGVTRSANHDAFGLAVVIFQLLFMGRHPFVGTTRKGAGDPPALQENIRLLRYAYTDLRNVGMDQPPGTPSIADFHPKVAEFFDKAFGLDGLANRPSSNDWVAVLDELESRLVKCQDNPLHFIPQGSSECAWCDMERQLGTILFLPNTGTLPASHNFSASNFDLEAIWRVILGIKNSFNGSLNPRFHSANPEPSLAAKAAKKDEGSTSFVGPAVMVGSVIAFFMAPKAFLFWLFTGYLGYVAYGDKKNLDPTPFTSAYEACENIFNRELDNWNKKNGVDKFIKLYEELNAAYDDYKLVEKNGQRLVSVYTDNRRSLQLKSFLDAFSLDQTRIRGIGPSKRAVLASYGIDTAADIEKSRLLGVPGFGAANSQPLLEWRAKLEARFVYRPDLTAGDHASIAQIKIQTEGKLKPLRDRLVAGPQALQLLIAQIQKIASIEDSNLSKAKFNKEQARRDLEFLGIAIPTIAKSKAAGAAPPRTTSISLPRSATPKAPTSGGHTSSVSNVICPRCSSSMVKRLAKKGRNAGHYFWGCSRYPGCKGTRNA